MLREVFRSVPIPYLKKGDKGYHNPWFGVFYTVNKLPYVENLGNFTGLTVGAHPTPKSPVSIYVFCRIGMWEWPSWGASYYRFDGTSGKLVKRIFGGAGNMGEYMLGQKVMTRSGAYWVQSFYGDSLLKMILGATGTSLTGEEPKNDESYWWYGSAFGEPTTPGYAVHASFFKNLDGSQALSWFRTYAIDDVANRFIHGWGSELAIFEWTTGALKYKMAMPHDIAAFCLEDESRMYILLNNRTVITFDYLRGEVLGAVKIPKLLGGGNYFENGKVKIAWDITFRRLLVVEQTPNDPVTGAATSYIRGFRFVPMPVRLTTPIPLKVPRQGRQIPVLVQVVGDNNEGVAGYQVESKVMGAGMLMGVPVTNHKGDTNIQVLCAERDIYYDIDPGSGIEINAPEQWEVRVEATAIASGPDPEAVPRSGTSGTVVSGQPGPPNAGSGTYGPNEMPNLKFIVDNVFASQSWRLDSSHEQDIDGSGAFVAKCVTAMHDVDGKFGNYLKIAPSKMYVKTQRSINAVCYKNADGLTQEGATIIVSGKPGWTPVDRSPAIAVGLQNSWIYP